MLRPTVFRERSSAGYDRIALSDLCASEHFTSAAKSLGWRLRALAGGGFVCMRWRRI